MATLGSVQNCFQTISYHSFSMSPICSDNCKIIIYHGVENFRGRKLSLIDAKYGFHRENFSKSTNRDALCSQHYEYTEVITVT